MEKVAPSFSKRRALIGVQYYGSTPRAEAELICTFLRTCRIDIHLGEAFVIVLQSPHKWIPANMGVVVMGGDDKMSSQLENCLKFQVNGLVLAVINPPYSILI